MITETEEKIKRDHTKFVPRLSQEEKDIIERISGTTGYRYNTVKNIFQALSTIYGMEILNNPEISIPYLFKLKVDLSYDSDKKKVSTKFAIHPFHAFRNVSEKMFFKDESWLHEYYKTHTRNSVSQMLDIKEEHD